MEITIYWSSIEYHYNKEAKEFGDLQGGIVYVFVKATDVRDALDKILKQFKANKMSPIEVEFVSPYDERTQWESPEATEYYIDLYKQALYNDEVVFDEASTYEQEEED